MAEVKYNLGTLAVVPSGAVIPFAGSTAPVGFLLCDGSEVSRTDYSYLFDVIGTTYGEGDGNTTFNLPNLQDKFIEGSGTNAVGTEMSAGLPNITGSFVPGSVPDSHVYYGKGAFGGFVGSNDNIGSLTNKTNKGYGYVFDASSSNSIYGNSDTVQPPAICMNYIIKY